MRFRDFKQYNLLVLKQISSKALVVYRRSNFQENLGNTSLTSAETGARF